MFKRVTTVLLLSASSAWAAPPAAGTTTAAAPTAPAAPAAAKAAAPAASPAPANAAPRDPAAVALERLALSIQRVTLDNGLRVVLNKDSSSPTVAVSVTYDVGSRSEGPGQSGFAHLFEHMMFQGSQNVKKGQHFGLITERGGTLNGTTSSDRTNYFESLPSSELELALFLEADRMRWLAVTAENFENQRAVVKEEYRMRVDNAPFGRAHLRLGELTFADYFPYAHPTIGSMQDLDAAKLEWVADFYKSHYAPNNAVLAIAGDFDTDQALELVRKYFGPAEKRQVPPFVSPTTPKDSGTLARREVVEDKNTNTPGILWGYRIPPARSPDHYALELAALLLSDGESSRLYQKLVRDRAILQQVAAWTDDRRGPDMFGLMGVLTEKAKLEDVERAFEAELDRLRKTPPSAAELARVKARLKHDFVFALQSNGTRSTRLGEYEVFFGDARILARELGFYLAVTPEDVKRVSNEYLRSDSRFAIEVRPARAPGAKP
ncbi:MAG TPA: pitrilysin family protein [Polyangiaceae bacterium]|jgi:predicted Zn-dependent peptidase|nr:pitrilysin family protein [Polyangiaceae bacterium]